eukprot:CAMPEP_0194508048 /NCGR_PEP_ID=MMETSP0253-20130528/37929_1 /TAXON_ID=2966 /ORGANISM="Noctiluca scintillans" /LENGTH=244 /DNA_ID=CAMNT_0039351019 /DNA_START=9 /DNA_END=743 /DNA_ORIENTATION=+
MTAVALHVAGLHLLVFHTDALRSDAAAASMDNYCQTNLQMFVGRSPDVLRSVCSPMFGAGTCEVALARVGDQPLDWEMFSGVCDVLTQERARTDAVLDPSFLKAQLLAAEGTSESQPTRSNLELKTFLQLRAGLGAGSRGGVAVDAAARPKRGQPNYAFTSAHQVPRNETVKYESDHYPNNVTDYTELATPDADGDIYNVPQFHGTEMVAAVPQPNVVPIVAEPLLLHTSERQATWKEQLLNSR